MADDTPPTPTPTPTPADHAALMARLHALEADNARLRHVQPSPPAQRQRTRAAAAVALVLLGCLLAPVAVLSSWARGLVVDTDRYVDTVAPIAEDPSVRSAVSDRITLALVDALDIEGLTTQTTEALAGLDVPPVVARAVTSLRAPLQEAITAFIRRNVTTIVSSDVFATTWKQANRKAHEQIVATLRGDPEAIASISDSAALTLDITPIIAQVKASLEQAGFGIVSRIPAITVSFPIAASGDLVRLQSAYRLIDVAGAVLPWFALGLLAAGVLASRHRPRALVAAGLSLATTMLLLSLALSVGRSFYASSLPPTVQRVDTAVSIYDQVISLLRVALRVGLVLGLLVAAVAFVAGGTTAARSLRTSFSSAAAWLRTAGERRGLNTGPVGLWLDEQRSFVRVVVVALAALALVLADRLTPGYLVTVAVIALLVLGLATLAARPGPVATDEETSRPA